MSRILFVTDPHGADAVLEKSLQAVREYDISAYILSGDLSAKDIRPIVQISDGAYLVNRAGRQVKLSLSDIKEAERTLSATGHYHFRCNQKEMAELQKDKERVTRLMHDKTLEQIDQWAKRILAYVNVTKTRVLVTPGNDDIPEVDDLLASYESRGIHSHVDQPFSLENNEIVTLDYSNPTPWCTSREAKESELRDIIEERVRQINRPEKAIFNFHCPPLRTKLDLAPKLNGDLKPVVGVCATIEDHVGSSAVRAAIEKYQPVLGQRSKVSL